MNFLAFFKTRTFENARERCVQHSLPDAKRHAVVALGALLFAISAQDLSAQVGDNNPGGHSGIFNGQINTGCSYDPYTGNATRSITDIAVAGAVGEYPLALVRTANSRAPSTTEVFGFAGGWNHNYNWILEESEHSQTQNFHPASYTVEFPDGRVETFKQVNWDTCYRARASNGGADSSAGVRERFLPLDLSTRLAYLVLPDGGVIEFTAVRYTNGNHNRWWYKYHATAIHDPHGLRTQLVSSTTDNGVWRRLDWVIEPAGRSLHFLYTGTNSPRIASVTASDGRTVNYHYSYTMLDNVVYYNNANWTAHYQYVASNTGADLPSLLRTADDPMYAGPMHKIGYIYGTTNNPDGSTPAYGQIQSENYYDGTTVGAAISTLTVGEANPVNHNKRKETRGDNATRTFTYDTGGYLTACTDFMGHGASQGYDSKKYVNYVIDRRNNRTDYINDPITGNVLQIQFPFTHEDTPNQSVRPTINYIYGGAGCPDPNNGNPYWLCTVTDEAGNQTQFTREPVAHRVTRIDYPDGGYEMFAYDAAHFYQVSSHRMKTGGTETFAYDGQHRLQYYSDPYHSNPSNPSMSYFYDARGRVSGVVDALNHSTNWDYNDRGQVMVTTLPWMNSVRYTISNLYYPDGALQKRTDELGHFTTYTYDDYRRLKSVTPPARDGTHTTQFYYGVNAIDNVADYKYTDSNVTWVVLPSLKKIKTTYDDNRRKSTVTVAPATEPATISYTYDNVGNLRIVTNPRGYAATTEYDERNRPYSMSVPGQTTTLTYDTAGHKKTITRPNGQVITYVSFDEMNRVLQQNVTQTPDPTAITKYTYHPSGLLHTMQDPRLVSTNSTEQYEYLYDSMARKTWVIYPKDSANLNRSERFTYDAAGRPETFKNRAGHNQTFTYDALNRMTDFSWNDGLTPSVHFTYDAASRLTGIDNANATISRSYYNDNLLNMETQNLSAIGGVDNRRVTYTYDEDGNLATLGIPGYSFTYDYTNRNQLNHIKNGATTLATYAYDQSGYIGDLTTRTLNNSTSTGYLYDSLDRPTWITHTLNGTSRGFNYAYDNSNNRKYVRRTGSSLGDEGDTFLYDLADQVTGVALNVSTPQSSPPPLRSILYDANGNRTSFSAYGPTYTYTIDNNSLNQYNKRNNISAVYDGKSNLTIGVDGSGYTYDAQNRLLSANKNGTTMSFKYDGLNRQVSCSRTVSGTNTTTYSTWEGWNLVEEYTNNPQLVVQARYLYGPTGLVKELQNNRYYYQDGSGSTSHLTDSSGHLLEWYRYDLHGTPFFYAPSDTQRSTSNYSVRHLFTGQQWHQDIGLYDLRNRFYSPDLGRFLQPDPIGFWGGNNLYRYCRNNPVTRWDPLGLQVGAPTLAEKGIVVEGKPIDNPIITRIFEGFPSFGGPSGLPGGIPFDGPENLNGFTFIAFKHGAAHQGNGQHQSTSRSEAPQQNPQTVGFDIYHPKTTAEFIIAGNIIEHGDTTDTTPAIDPIDLLSGGIAALVRSSIRPVVQKAAVFWAGGRAAEDAARTFAKASGGTVIADTAAGRALMQSTANIPRSQALNQWVSLSEDFARSASGEVHVFQNARGVPLGSMWRNEYQILSRNPNVTGINFSVVMPDGSVVPVP